jgi:hypothetical protein
LNNLPTQHIRKSHKYIIYDIFISGAGQSEGSLSGQSYRDILVLVEWIRCSLGAGAQIVLWARGMSTACAIEFCSGNTEFPNAASHAECLNAIKYIVLDGPYESIQRLVNDCIEKLKRDGYSIPTMLISVFSNFVRSTLNERTGVDPYAVVPLRIAPSVDTPALIVASTKDDYISYNNGVNIAEAWGGPCRLRMYELAHFEKRPTDLFEFAASEIGTKLQTT